MICPIKVLHRTWLTLMTITCLIIVLYLYVGTNISIKVKFIISRKESVIDSYFNPEKWKDKTIPRPILNIKKLLQSLSSTTTKPTTTQESTTATTATTTDKVTTQTTTTLTSTQKPTTSPTTTVKSTVIPMMNSTVQTTTAQSLTTLSPNVRTILNRGISKKDKAILMDLVTQFLRLAYRLNLTYFMYSGTLLGSWRHHGMIPWDDDVDFLVKLDQKPKLLDAIKEMKPAYFGPDTSPIIKFYSNRSSTKIQGRKWRWPFIDICFYNETKTEIWDTVVYFSKTKYKKSRIFPLHKRPFEEFEIWAPRDSCYFFRRAFPHSLTTCCTQSYSHKKEQSAQPYSVACERLKNLVPFVHRRVVNNTMEEILKLGNKIVHTKFVHEDPENLCGPYDLRRS